MQADTLSMQPMSGSQLMVQHCLSGREIRSFELEIEDRRTVGDLKKELSGYVECPPRRQTLVCGKRPLKDEEKLLHLPKGEEMCLTIQWQHSLPTTPTPDDLWDAVRRTNYSEVEALLQLSSDPNLHLRGLVLETNDYRLYTMHWPQGHCRSLSSC